jgi:hypothetical protein
MTLRIETTFYCTGVGVQAGVHAWAGADTGKFASTVKGALEEIRSTEVGSGLLTAIDQATNELLIVKAVAPASNGCEQPVAGEQEWNAACYTEVLTTQALFDKINALKRKAKDAQKKFQKFAGKSIYSEGEGNERVEMAHKKYPSDHSTEQIVSGKQSDAAINNVQWLRRGLIAYHIMDHLTPGPGTKAWVYWDPLLVRVCTDLPAERRAAWMDLPKNWIALAHELIHGWRIVTGRCVFRPGPIERYYEEAMTVGLPPYDRCPFTENRLRLSKGLPLRTFYGEDTQNLTNRAASKHGSVDSRLKSN